jgi:GMP synthase (glutamine-hydrolysing)
VRNRLLVIQSDPDKALGRLADPLMDAGVEVDMRSPEQELPVTADYDGLIVLPGLANPVDETEAIRRSRGAIQGGLEAGIPVLGLCLGAELLIEELGGTAYACPPELAFREVFASRSASDDPLLCAAPERFSIFHAHTFAFEPPSDAEILLSNDVCVQACRQGQTWAIQCHPEATRAWVSALAGGMRGENAGLLPATADFFKQNGVDPDQLERDADMAEPTLSAIGEQIAKGFALAVAESRAAPSKAP